jgi:adiponectin receptor
MLKASELPSWYKNTLYIQSGYRPPSTYIQSLASLFQLHNETLNIHTHFWPGIIFLYMFSKEHFTDSLQINFCIGFGYFGAITCMFASAYSHTFKNIDSVGANICSKVDYIGIIIVNLSHQILDTYILFRDSHTFYILLSLESLFAIKCINDTLYDLGPFWGLVYPFLSCAYSLYTYMYGLVDLKNASTASLNCSAAVIVAGLVFFKGRVPERFCNPRGIFDYCSSHVFHHICIVYAINFALSAPKHLH